MRSCHVNPVTIPGILRFLPLVCSDYICFLSFLTPVIYLYEDLGQEGWKNARNRTICGSVF